MKNKLNKLATIVVTTTLLTGLFVSSTFNLHIDQAFAEPEMFAIQKTDKSRQDPIPGHEAHQYLMALPLREDGKMYTGQVTYAASKPVEIVVFNPFNVTATDEQHGQPINVPFENKSVAISLMKQFNGEFNAGSTTFTGSALVFHNINGEPFSVTYAVAGKLLNQTAITP